MFLQRSMSFAPRPVSLAAAAVSLLIGTLISAVVLKRAVVQRVGRVAGLLEVVGAKASSLTMTMPPPLDALDVRPQGGRIHRHQRVDLVAGREDVGAGEVDLETRHAGERAGGGISAGKSGSVLMSLPTSAEVSVNCVPAKPTRPTGPGDHKKKYCWR